jgi:hypothetical protein
LEQLERRELLAGDLALTEFMASNATAHADADGHFMDWLEVYNAGTDAVDLAGWRLTDDAEELDKWEFPARILAPDEYLVVFASGKNRTPTDGELHTNFKLRSDGEYVALVSPAGVVMAEYGPGGSAFPPQSPDISYGIPAAGGAPGYRKPHRVPQTA